MFVAKGLGKFTITAAGNVETAAGGRYKMPVQRWELGNSITGNVNFPNNNNHKNIEFNLSTFNIASGNSNDAVTYSDTDSTVMKLLGSGIVTAGNLSGNTPTGVTASRAYQMCPFGSARNTTDTGILPSITAATNAANGVFTFSSDVTAGSGTNGTLSTTAPNNVFRIGFRGPEDDQGAWMRTLFTVTNISANGRTVTVSNNTTSFPSWSGTQSRVGTISLAPQNDRIWRGTFRSYQATNSTNSQNLYGVGEYSFNDTTMSGGPGGGSIGTEQVMGSIWHIVTLRPGRWYSFRAYGSQREHSRGRNDCRWQVSGLPSTFTKSWGSATNSPNANNENGYLHFYGYTTTNILVSISGESENNVRGDPSGGGPKTPFIGATGIWNSSGTVQFPATNNGNPYAPDYFAFNGAGITKNTDGTVTSGIDFSNHTGSYSRTGFLS